METLVSCWDNLLTVDALTGHKWPWDDKYDIHNFLSFGDAFDYLIKAFSLEGEKILMPAFYCDATIRKISQQLKIVFTRIDREEFDVLYDDFLSKVKREKPRVILIYNFLGKNSILYRRTDWLRHISPDTIIISDFAHSLLPNHSITFFTENHFYIDSARKCTPFMIGHLIAPKGYRLQKEHIKPFSIFKIYARLLFLLKNRAFRLALWSGSGFFSRIANNLSSRHNQIIGEKNTPNLAFNVDHLLYSHINFDRVVTHRKMLFKTYGRMLRNFKSPFVRCFDIPESEAGNICFYFMSIDPHFIDDLTGYFLENGFVIEQLWDFDSVNGRDENFRKWARSIVIFPYSMHTRVSDVENMCRLLRAFFHEHSNELSKLVS